MRFLALDLAIASSAAGQIRFDERPAGGGLDFRLANGATGRFRQVELKTGGAGALDFDGDGCWDV